MANDLLRGRQTIETLTNRSGVPVYEGNVVIVDDDYPESFTTIAEEGQTDWSIGIAIETIANGDDGRVVFFGHTPKAYLDSYANIGDYILSSATAGTGTVSTFLRGGVFGQTLGSGTHPPALIWGLAPLSNSVTGSGGGGHTITDNDVAETDRANLNFEGNFVSVSDDAGNNATDVLITGTPGHIIQDEGVAETQRSNLNFVGSGVNVTDDAGNDATVVTISVTGSGGVASFSGCRTKRTSGNVTAVSATDTAIEMTSEDFDTDGYHDNSTNPSRHTIPAGKDGYYMMGGTFFSEVNCDLYLKLNGTTHLAVCRAGAGDSSIVAYVANTIYYLSEGDYVELIATGRGGNKTVYADSDGPVFWMGLLGT